MIGSKLLGDTLWFTAGSFFFQGSRFITQLYAAKQLGPTLFGLWQSLFLVLAYGMRSHLGVLNAMNRDIPFYDGAGRTDRIAELREISLGTVERSALLLAGLLFGVSYGFESPATQTGLRYIALMMIFQQIYLYYQMLLKSHRLFRLMSLQQMAYAALTLAMVLPLIHYFGFQGFLGGQLLVLAVTLLFIRGNIPFSIVPSFDWQKAKRLSQIGFPIMLAGLVFNLFTTADRLVILRYLGQQALGYYSLSIMATGILLLIPMTVAQIIYPQMSRKYGQTGQPLALTRLIYIPTLYLLAIMVPVLAGVYFLFPIFIRYFLSQYLPGIPALQITVFGVFFLSLSFGFANFLNTVGLQKRFLIIQTIAIGIVVVLNWMSIRLGYGIEGIAMATTVSYTLYAAMLIGSTHFQLKKGKSRP